MHGGISYYTILEIDHYATRGEIKQAYRQLAKKHHPDLNPNDPTAEEQFQKINEAYETLYDSNKRVRYDSGFENAFRATYSSNTYSTAQDFTQSGYGYTDFGTAEQNIKFENLSFLEKAQLYSKFALKNLPAFHYIVLVAMGILLLIIPIDSSLSFSRYTGVSMRLMFFVIHALFSSYWVERSCHNLKGDFMMLPTMVMFTHGAAAILTAIATVMIQALIAMVLHMPKHILDSWSQV